MGRFERFVGLLITTAALLGAGLVALAVSSRDPAASRSPTHGLLLGAWNVFYDTEMPSLRVLLGAAGLALVLGAGVALVDRRIVNRSRRSLDATSLPLAPRVVMAETEGVFAGPVTVTVLIPAHNEEGCIAETLRSLFAQSHPPQRVVVVADNCTDGTVSLAHRAGVEVFETLHNRAKKAGALNQALARVLPSLSENDLVMVMDADTTLDAGFLEAAVQRATDDRGLMAIGGLFYGDEGEGMLGQFQRNEYIRYSRELRRRRGRVYVLTGTASLFRPRALRTVAAERGRGLPGRAGDVYDTVALTEDNELTISLKSLGALMVSPSRCTVVTEVMPTWRALWAQRLRWQRGALENLGAFGPRPQTARYWAQQVGIGYGVLALGAYLVQILLLMSATDTWVWFPFWLGIGFVFTLERLVTVWRGGWRARLLALTLFPELGYAFFLGIVYVKGIADLSLAKEATWKHVVQSQPHVQPSAPSPVRIGD